MENKSQLCFACDVENVEELEKKLNLLADKIDILKLHPDIIDGWNDKICQKIKELKSKHHFKIWIDLKLCDVGHIMVKQFHHWAWADWISVMSIIGIEAMDKLTIVAKETGTEIILVSSLHTNGKRIWKDEDDEKLAEMASYEEIIASVGRKLPGLLYIQAGISEKTMITADIIVKGRSLLLTFD